MRFDLIEAPAKLPVTKAEFEAATRQSGSNVDDTFSLTAATSAVEAFLGFRLIKQKWQVAFDCQPIAYEFPRLHVNEITAAITVLEDGSEAVEDTSIYSTVIGDNARLWLRSGESWTQTERLFDRFKIQFYQGWADDVGDYIPADLKGAVKAAILAMAEVSYYDGCEGGDCMNEEIMQTLSGYKRFCV